MYEYDFSKFKKSDDIKIDSSRLASTPAKIDIFSKFEELDNISNSENKDFVEQTFEEQTQAYSAPANDSKEDIFNTTINIDTINDEVLENYEKIINNEENSHEAIQHENQITINDKPIKEKKQPMNIATAFINCSVLGFITIFFGYGMFFYIMSHI